MQVRFERACAGLEIYLIQLFNALSVSSILLLIALGLAFAFGLMNVINMAHGELIMAGAYTAYVMERAATGGLLAWAGPGVSFWLSLPVSFVVGAVLATTMEALLIRHLYGRPLDTLLATLGVSVALQQAARDIFGAPNVQVTAPAWLRGGVEVFGLYLPMSRLFILALAAVAVASVYWYLYRTGAGRRIRATMQNRAVAESQGIDTRRVDAVTFALGGGLAGLAGCALTLLGPIGPALGTYHIVDAFMVVVLGGLGQLAGTAVAALAIGSAGAMFELGMGTSLAKAAVFALVILFLQFRPSGIIAVRSRAID